MYSVLLSGRTLNNFSPKVNLLVLASWSSLRAPHGMELGRKTKVSGQFLSTIVVNADMSLLLNSSFALCNPILVHACILWNPNGSRNGKQGGGARKNCDHSKEC